MKVTVIGDGKVGKAVFRELQALREINELALVGRNEKACKAEAEDYLDGIPLKINTHINVKGGGYELAQDSDILIYCAGPSVTVEDRLSILYENFNIMKEVFAEIDKYAPDAIVICVTNPLDVITTAIQKYTGRPREKVIGTGILLDTARLKKIISLSLGVSTDNVSGMVIGEHGASSVVCNSGISVLGMPIQDYIDCECDGQIPMCGEELEADVRDAGFKIFRGKGYTSAGVACTVTRIVFDIINDTHFIYPVSTVLDGQYDVNGYAISVPCMIGREGILSVKNIKLNENEQERFKQSAKIIETSCRKCGLI